MPGIKKFFGRAFGAFMPVDTINRTQGQQTSKPPPQAPAASQHFEPPAKKQKRDGSDSYTYSELTFAPGPEPHTTPVRRPSASSIRSGVIQQKAVSVQSSSKTNSQMNVDEFRAMDKRIQPPKRKRPRYRMQGSISNPQILDDSDVAVEAVEVADDEDDEDSVHLLETYRQDSRKAVHVDDYSRRFAKAQHTTNNGDWTRFNPQKRKSSRDHAGPRKLPKNSSPDPLAEDMEPGNRNLAKPRAAASSSESRRGEIQPSFKRIPKSTPRHRKDNEQLPDIVRARGIIKNGLRIESAVDGRHKFTSSANDKTMDCFLRLEDVSTILLPTNRSGEEMQEYSYLTVDLKSSNVIKHAELSDRIVSVARSTNPGMSVGPKLYLKFAEQEELKVFLEWVQMKRGEPLSSLKVLQEDSKKLDDSLSKSREKATQSKVLRDPDNAKIEVPEDIQLMEQQQQEEEAKRAQNSTKPKLHDSMQPIPSSHKPRKEDSIIIPESPTASTTRTTRTRASKHIEREPTPKGWTEDNPGWEKQWRNSLVFPRQGKNRATVDKDDILRLDEGQFLNDNLIIFGLRYLEDKLEKERPEIAKRVHFHNTFFFDKLKPSRSGSGINYDSVKGWTSKVDLFTKDFIVVPINEHAHWYVAIIYNAPRLMPGEAHPALDGAAKTVDDVKHTASEAAEPTISDKNVTTEDTIAPGKVVPFVEEGMRRMSLSSSSGPIELSDRNKEHSTDVQGGEHPAQSHDIMEPVKSDVDLEEIQCVSPASRKRTSKKSNMGQRKHDTNQPKIITLDSLGSAHSPACSYLRQYLVAELKDKKGIEIPDPGKLGITAKNIPLQENYCDCGLYLLGYIHAFQEDPDKFVRSILQYDEPCGGFNSSSIRHSLRDLIFELQAEQQERENHEESEKRDKKRKAAEQRHNLNRASSSEEKPQKQSSNTQVDATTPSVVPDNLSALRTCQKSTAQSTIDASALLDSNKPAANNEADPAASHGSKLNEPLLEGKPGPHNRRAVTKRDQEADVPVDTSTSNLTSSKLSKRSESSDTRGSFVPALESSGPLGETSRNPVDVSSSPDITKKLQDILHTEESKRRKEKQREVKSIQDPDAPQKSVEHQDATPPSEKVEHVPAQTPHKSKKKRPEELSPRTRTDFVVQIPSTEFKKRMDAANSQSSRPKMTGPTSDYFRRTPKQEGYTFAGSRYVDNDTSPSVYISD